MNSPIKTDHARNRDVWLWLLVSLIIYIFASPIIASVFTPYFPYLSSVFFGLIAVILSMLVPIIYFSFRYTPIAPSDFIPGINDIPVLFIAIAIVFVFASLGILGGGWRNETIEELRKAGNLQFFFGYFSVVVIGPILEETLWRKYILGILRQTFPILAAGFITVALETAFHFGYLRHGIKPLIRTFFCVMFYTIIYLNSSLGVSIIAHSTLNFFILTLAVDA